MSETTADELLVLEQVEDAVEWLLTSKPGSSRWYHEGNLARDREQNRAANALGALFWRAAIVKKGVQIPRGVVALVQQPIYDYVGVGVVGYRYIAQKVSQVEPEEWLRFRRFWQT